MFEPYWEVERKAALHVEQGQDTPTEAQITILPEEELTLTMDTKDHVDTFIDYGSIDNKKPEGEPHLNYARWMLNHFRLPAMLSFAFAPFMEEHKLFATYNDKRYRVVGASRLGDIWLTNDFSSDSYQVRVSILEVSKWSPQP